MTKCGYIYRSHGRFRAVFYEQIDRVLSKGDVGNLKNASKSVEETKVVYRDRAVLLSVLSNYPAKDPM